MGKPNFRDEFKRAEVEQIPQAMDGMKSLASSSASYPRLSGTARSIRTFP